MTEPGDKNSFNALGGGWQSIETAPTGYKLLVKYHNSIGKARYVLACYYEANTLESEETESGFAAEGWYEESETHDVILPIDRPPEKWMHIPRDDGAQPHLPSDRASEIMGEADCEAYDEKVQEVLESINAFNAAHPEHLKFSAQIWAMIRHLAAFRTLHRMGRGDASEIRPNDPPTDDDLFFGHVSAIQSAWQRLNEFQAGSRGPYTGLPTDLAVVLRALKRTPEKPKDNLVPQSQENAVGEESTLAAAFRAGWFARNNHRDNDIQSADLQYAKQKRSLKQSLKP